MARSRKTAEATVDGPAPDVFDQAIAAQQAQTDTIVQQVADGMQMPPVTSDPAQAAAPAKSRAATVTTKRNAVEHSKRRFPAGDLMVHYMDKADNSAGIGVMIEFPSNRKPTDEEKEIIRRIMKGEGEQYPTDFNWRNDFGMWHKHFERPGEDIRDVPMNRIRAIRYDAEKRAGRLAEALLQHQADPIGYAEMVKQQRQQAAQGERIPD
jgi:hypothetical protein